MSALHKTLYKDILKKGQNAESSSIEQLYGIAHTMSQSMHNQLNKKLVVT